MQRYDKRLIIYIMHVYIIIRINKLVLRQPILFDIGVYDKMNVL